MKSEIDKKDFDIALLGCGAYGVPLAAHIKQNGKEAVYVVVVVVADVVETAVVVTFSDSLSSGTNLYPTSFA